MRTTSLLTVLFLAGYLLVATPVAKADFPREISVYANTYTYFDHQGGVVYGWADLNTGYVFKAYYSMNINLELTDGEGNYDYGNGFSSGQSWSDYQTVTAYTHLVAEAEKEYTVTAEYDVVFSFDDEYAGFSYYDFYRYAFQNIYEPDWYSFIGYWLSQPPPGGGSSQRVGKAYSKKKVGKPHHVWLIDDKLGSGDCGQLVRVMRYYVVDESNRRTGVTPIKEHFPGGSFVDSCNGGTVTTSGFASNTDAQGRFADVHRTGCPTVGGDCGFTVYPGYFQYAPPNKSPTNIALFHRDVRYGSIGINGRYTAYPADAQFFPY